jgi:succinate-semialdehyde dehydrogenase / glutarate-semialdehyde dehydrogenase
MNAQLQPTSLSLATQLKDSSLLKTECFIGGQWIAGADHFSVNNPADGSDIAQVPMLGAAHTQQAINAAAAAQPTWQGTTGKERAKVLRKWFELILANSDDLALILSTENGKPLAEARGEIAYGASFVEWFAEEAKRTYGDVIPSPSNSMRLMTIKQPVGVVAAITPWNFPNAMITRKVAPGLAAGCTYVLKPAEQTPLSALALAELAHRAGVPSGVLNIITGDGPTIGKVLCESDVVRKLTFTGSTEVGRILMRQCANTIKKLSLELGGNAPFIVFDDADLDAAADGLVNAKFRNAGQTCICPNRIYVQTSVYDTFASKVRERMLKLKVGPANEVGVTVGPLIDSQGHAKVIDHVADAVGKGAKVSLGGNVHALGGLFYEPTLLTGVTTAMKVAKEETFGPVAPLFKFETEADAIALANDSEFGLASYLFSRDIGRCIRVAERIESGMVGINTGVLGNEMSPFGGVKQSGLGREGSRYGIEDFLEIKYLALGGIQ